MKTWTRESKRREKLSNKLKLRQAQKNFTSINSTGISKIIILTYVGQQVWASHLRKDVPVNEINV